jgi:hypothetical protein
VADPFGLRSDDLAYDEDAEPAGRLSTTARTLLSLSLVLLVGAVIGAGAAGLLVAVSVLAAVAVLVLALRLPGGPVPRARRRPGPPVDNEPYRAYRQVAEQLSWAAVSRRHYDLATRPLLTQLAAARLADRHRIDVWADPDAARAVVGEDVWPWVDPHREPSRDSQPPGVGRDTLTLIVERLEKL